MTKLNGENTKLRIYDYTSKWEETLSPEIVLLLTKIHELKGRQNLVIEQKKQTLTGLLEIAKIQSTQASNKIEGIYTSDERLKLIALDKTTPQSRSEAEIAGYRDVLATIHDNHNFIPIKPSMILQLHRDLYKYSAVDIGGRYKSADNQITEITADGEKRIRFTPISAFETPSAMEEICIAYTDALANGIANPLILICMFILDFLCIHGFADGNGRMSRLVTLLLLYRSDYNVGKYISIEKIIEQSKESYYGALEKSSQNWHENENDYKPFINYMLGVLISAYREFNERADIIMLSGVSKPERVAKIIEEHLGKISKQEIIQKCPDISDTTVQRTLNELVKSEKIIKIGGGRYTKYTWNRGE